MLTEIENELSLCPITFVLSTPPHSLSLFLFLLPSLSLCQLSQLPSSFCQTVIMGSKINDSLRLSAFCSIFVSLLFFVSRSLSLSLCLSAAGDTCNCSSVGVNVDVSRSRVVTRVDFSYGRAT